MRIIVCENYEEISKEAAKIVASQLVIKPNSVLGLATGSTPIGMYKLLAEMNKNGEIDFSRVTTFNLDEYYPIAPENDQSYRYFMNKNLFNNINIDINKTFVLDGLASDPKAECESFEEKIEAAGGVDLQILGIGQNGHIGFNEPGANVISKTHLTRLTENTIKANSRFFDSIDDVPKESLTMGISTILKSRKIVILASGASKHRAVDELINGEITTSNPSTMLKVHSDVILICDKAAYTSKRIGVDIGGTDIKFGVMDDSKKIIYKDSVPTDCSSDTALINQIAEKCKEIIKLYSVDSIGVGTPGLIKNGRVSAGNLPFKNTELEKQLSNALNMPVSVNNDANCAALGEAIFGAGKTVDNIIMVTLGTGIGGGIVIDKKIYQGAGGAGEIGHMCIDVDGLPCSCGKKGCWERYASTGALVERAVLAAKENPDSILYGIYSENGNKMNGKLFFEAIRKGCNVARGLLDTHIDSIVVGIRNLVEVFGPEMIVLSGGITNEGDMLLKPIVERAKIDIPIKISELKSDAGIVGAAML